MCSSNLRQCVHLERFGASGCNFLLSIMHCFLPAGAAAAIQRRRAGSGGGGRG